jgi:hypothetical protein
MSDQSEFNKIRVESEKLLLLEDSLGWDKARLMAVDNKAKAFGSLFNILSKPNPDDIEIIYEEKRFEAFWHVVGTSHFEYKRNHYFHVPVSAEVEDVEVLGKNFIVNRDTGNFEIEGVEHCREKYREELMIDANTDQPGNFVRYLKFPHRKITSTDELIQDGTPIAHLETRANTLVRTVLGSLVKPIKADQILFEDITVHDLDLYFYPVYTFEYHWKLKDKKATVSFDGVTTEINLKAAKISDTLKKNFTSEDLYEFSKEIAQNLVPGGALAMMVGKKVFEMTKKKA